MLLSIPPGYWCHPASLPGTTATPEHAQAEGSRGVSTNMGFKHQMDHIFFLKRKKKKRWLNGFTREMGTAATQHPSWVPLPPSIPLPRDGEEESQGEEERRIRKEEGGKERPTKYNGRHVIKSPWPPRNVAACPPARPVLFHPPSLCSSHFKVNYTLKPFLFNLLHCETSSTGFSFLLSSSLEKAPALKGSPAPSVMGSHTPVPRGGYGHCPDPQGII